MSEPSKEENFLDDISDSAASLREREWEERSRTGQTTMDSSFHEGGRLVN